MARRLFAILLAASAITCFAQTPVERAFANAKKNPGALRAFLYKMPKGGDLHVHLGGAVYAENVIDAAAHGTVCVDTTSMKLVTAKATTRSLPPQPVCGDSMVRASEALADQKLYDALINSFSMRSFVPMPGFSGHDQFFATFDKFSAGMKAKPAGYWVDEVATRAASQNEQYLELMQTPDLSRAVALSKKVDWHGDVNAAIASLNKDELRAAVEADAKELEAAETDRRQLEQCNTSTPKPACKVQVRFLFQVLRAMPEPLVFVQTLLAFEVANSSPNVVGLNFVQPEDYYLSMSQYHEQMQFIGALHALYPKVHISLHAGEIWQGLVAPDGLRFHIREAVEIAHAERIGHGVDVMYEDDANALLKEMAAKHIMVEINLTSNDVILGIKGASHPLASYLAARVPVALSTDDEGVSRIDLTNEYQRAVLEQGATYTQLKAMARTSLEHSFMTETDKAAALKEFDARVKVFETSFSSAKGAK